MLNKDSIAKYWNLPLFLSILGLSLLGIVFIYSAGIDRAGYENLYQKQILFLIVGVVLYFTISALPNFFIERYAVWGYVGGILLLILTLIVGVEIHGSKSWLNFGFLFLQTSEIGKIAYLLGTSFFMKRFRNQWKPSWQYMAIFLIASPYVLFIFLQPDYGTLLVYSIMLASFLYVSGFSIFYFMIGGIFVLFALSINLLEYLVSQHYLATYAKIYETFFQITWTKVLGATLFAVISYLLSLWVWKKICRRLGHVFLSIACIFILAYILYHYVMSTYHYQRILIFLNPKLDQKGAGYNILQSLISIGSGGIGGKGLFQGRQNLGNFLPAEHTDFMISLIAEELGFLGILFILAIYIYILVQFIRILNDSYDQMSYFFVFGVGAYLSAHLLINLLSAIGWFPIVGIPLPFLSYGGSSLITNFVAFGLVNYFKNKGMKGLSSSGF